MRIKSSHGSQPEEAGIASHQNGKRLTESDPINTKVSEEMFDSIIREVVEEIGVPASSLVSNILLNLYHFLSVSFLSKSQCLCGWWSS